MKNVKILLTLSFLLFSGVFCANTEPFSPPSSGTKRSTASDREIMITTLKTKFLIIFFAFFLLILLLVAMVVGHFTWFDELREKLKEEHHEKLAEERRRAAQEAEFEGSGNPFAKWESEDAQNIQPAPECNPSWCIPPHHSVLCPNNKSIPALNEPLRMESNNSISSLMLATPVPIRSSPSANDFYESYPIHRPSTPAASPGSSMASFAVKNSRFAERDLESGHPVRSVSTSPSQTSKSSSSVTHPRETLDISKIDLL